MKRTAANKFRITFSTPMSSSNYVAFVSVPGGAPNAYLTYTGWVTSYNASTLDVTANGASYFDGNDVILNEPATVHIVVFGP